MIPTTNKERIRLALAVSLILALATAGVWLAVSGHLQLWLDWLKQLFESKERLRDYVQSWGAWAPVAFLSMQVLQVLIAPIPGEISGIAGGFIFGAWKATLFSIVGLTLGSAIAFLAARVIGQPLVKLVVSQETMAKFYSWTHGSRTLVLLVLFLFPGFPKDLLSYFLGLTPMRFITFVGICFLGRLPGTLLLGVGGAAIYKENWPVLGIVSAIAIVLGLLVYWQRNAIGKWLER
ncbi:TVP38/TMEM64 family protein [Desulfomonile tiedjei]|uniref:TVP38/TMEM64 family membrane protein n=1 Tax=Desulfomonile tiedjei (strain ATCC 49306 / DSM 6799 / DCB-1) TaxID=706587 RepID=I4C382_DESTA|nr:TVP38/TMEM64 family protein [Desulfomonile tiedjei]AFM24023.1 hypothetical protein Desti_1310 [Desulfomonile tiedjei DSM 6799]